MRVPRETGGGGLSEVTILMVGSIYDHEDNDRRNAAAEAARAFANATEALRVPGEGLLLDDEGAGDEKPFRAKGVPGLRGAILNVREGLTALVQVSKSYTLHPTPTFKPETRNPEP